MLQWALAIILISGPGPRNAEELIRYPSQHLLDIERASGTPNLSVSGIDGGRSLNRTVYGFLPYWGSDTWLRYDLISILACFCVNMDSSGTVSAWNGFPGIFSESIDSVTSTGGIAVVTVTNFSSSQIHSILTTYRTDAINTIVDMVDSNPVTGVSIDFENVASSDRDNLTAFMEELRDQLDSQVPGSHLSICTPAVDWSGAFHYEALAQVSDAIFIMCYPFHGSWSSVAGPCCPLTGWGSSPESSSNMVWCMGDYVKYAPEYHDRIVVGLPYYGHEWETASGSAHSAVTGDCTTLIYSTLADRAATYGRLWDTESLTPWYAYYTSGWNQGWYDDDESLELKYDLIRQADFQGAGIWALGYDGSRDELWNSLEESFTGDVWSDSLTDNLESRCTLHGPAQYWRNVTQGGLFYGYFYTYSISAGPEVNWIEWNLQLPDSSGSYMLEVWLPGGGEATVDYRIVTGSGRDTVTVDQSLYSDEWVSLGGPWNASGGLSVEVGDLTGASGEKIVADAVRFCPPTGVSGPGGSTVTAGLSIAGANPSSRFQLLLPSAAGDGVLSIYDCAGRAVHRISVEGGSARTVEWPKGTALPEGIYTAVYNSDRGSMVRKLLLVY